MKNRMEVWIVAAFFGLLLAFGWMTYRSYGISTDEPYQIMVGEMNYNYITRADPALLNFRDRYYGPVTELILYTATRNLPNPQMIHTRHLLTFVGFWFAGILFFFLARRLLRSTGWGLLATAILVLSPRIWANSFYNSKDIPLLSAFITAFFTLVMLADAIREPARPRRIAAWVLLHSLATAVAIDHRLPAVILVAFTVILLPLLAIFGQTTWRKALAALSATLLLTASFTILFFPILWHDPLREFAAAFRNMSQFPFEIPVLYRAQFYPPTGLPADYLARWITISTPLAFLFGTAAGVLFLFMKFVQDARTVLRRTPFDAQIGDHLLWYAAAGWAFGPLVAIAVLQSTLYDSWRHAFFVYPAIALLAGLGFQQLAGRLAPLIKAPAWKRALFTAVAALIFFDSIRFLALYPTAGYVYFNTLAGQSGEIYARYDMDYWALSFKQGVDYIAAHDSSPKIKLYGSGNSPDLYIRYLLPEKDAARFVMVDSIEDADYFFTEYRLRNMKYGKFADNRYYNVIVDGNEIMTVFKFK